jgi:hypothetical protein
VRLGAGKRYALIRSLARCNVSPRTAGERYVRLRDRARRYVCPQSHGRHAYQDRRAAVRMPKPAAKPRGRARNDDGSQALIPTAREGDERRAEGGGCIVAEVLIGIISP